MTDPDATESADGPFLTTREAARFLKLKPNTLEKMRVYKRPVQLASGKFAVIVKSKEFTLVPWHAGLERHRGKMVGGVMRGSSLTFDCGKFAVIVKSKEFTLVPWHAGLERQRGKMVGGVMRGSSVTFDFGKKRGIGLG